MRVVESVDLVHQQLGLDRVVEPADRRLRGCRSSTAAATWSSQSVSSPACTKVGASCQPPGDAVVVEPVGELVLAVGGLQRAERGSPWRPVRPCAPGSRRASPAWPAGYGPAAMTAELVPHPGDPFPQRRGGPDGRRGGVVELVGEPGRQRAQRQQPFPLVDGPLGVLGAEEQALQQVHGHREPFAHDPARRTAAGRTKNRGRLGDPHGAVVRLRHAGRPGTPAWRPRTPRAGRCG